MYPLLLSLNSFVASKGYGTNDVSAEILYLQCQSDADESGTVPSKL
jgi:hypothetical protein